MAEAPDNRLPWTTPEGREAKNPQDVLIEELVVAKIGGRRVLPRDELVALAVSAQKSVHHWNYFKRHGADTLEVAVLVGLKNGAFKLVANNKIALGPGMRVMRHAEDGFERALDLPPDVLAKVLSFGDFETLTSSEISSRAVSSHTPRAWQSLALSEFPMLRLVADDDLQRDSREWRGIYRRSKQRFSLMYDDPPPSLEAMLPPPPPLNEYTFAFEIWSGVPQRGADLIECGKWNLGDDRRVCHGMHLIKPLSSLSAAARLQEEETYVRSIVAKRNSIRVESVALYEGLFCPREHPELGVENSETLAVRYASDLISRDSGYNGLSFSDNSPEPVTRISLTGETRHWSMTGVVKTIPARLVMEFEWRAEGDMYAPIEVSHFEHILDRYADWS